MTDDSSAEGRKALDDLYRAAAAAQAEIEADPHNDDAWFRMGDALDIAEHDITETQMISRRRRHHRIATATAKAAKWAAAHRALIAALQGRKNAEDARRLRRASPQLGHHHGAALTASHSLSEAPLTAETLSRPLHHAPQSPTRPLASPRARAKRRLPPATPGGRDRKESDIRDRRKAES